MIIPTTLVCAYFLALPSPYSSFNFIQTVRGSTQGEAAGYLYPAHTHAQQGVKQSIVSVIIYCKHINCQIWRSRHLVKRASPPQEGGGRVWCHTRLVSCYMYAVCVKSHLWRSSTWYVRANGRDSPNKLLTKKIWYLIGHLCIWDSPIILVMT